MGRRNERIASLIRQTIGQLILAKLSDPRIDPAKTSITHVEVAEDLLTAKVYVSFMGSQAEQRRTLRALQHAAGHIQELMMRQITLRHTPILEFEPDKKFKDTLKTLQIIDEAMAEIRQKELASKPADRTGEQAAGDEEP